MEIVVEDRRGSVAQMKQIFEDDDKAMESPEMKYMTPEARPSMMFDFDEMDEECKICEEKEDEELYWERVWDFLDEKLVKFQNRVVDNMGSVLEHVIRRLRVILEMKNIQDEVVLENLLRAYEVSIDCSIEY